GCRAERSGTAEPHDARPRCRARVDRRGRRRGAHREGVPHGHPPQLEDRPPAPGPMGRARPGRREGGHAVTEATQTADQHVLVTGASGLLGSSVARRLVEAGHPVTTLQRRPSGVEGARDVQGSVTDEATVAQALTVTDGLPPVTAVIHVAAKVSMAGDPADFDRINIEGTRALLAAARQAGVTRWVQISSPSVAHAGASLMGDGASPASPTLARGDYARTKAASELLALEADADDFRVLALRPHIIWGPGDAQLTERLI